MRPVAAGKDIVDGPMKKPLPRVNKPTERGGGSADNHCSEQAPEQERTR